MSRSALSPIERSVQKQVTSCFGDPSDLHFVLGVSGGVDSMVLLHIFCRLGLSAYVVHVNYRKRGAASDADARLVARMAEEWNCNYEIITADSDRAEGQNFQQWARDFRYGLMEDRAREQQADGVAVAHHRDDQIETILQKMFRGGGLASWSGMEVWDDPVFRPLLDISRDKIEAYAEREQIPFRTDRSNLESDFARNFLRNEWLAGLEDFFPGWQQNVLRIKKQAALFEQAIGWVAESVTDENGIRRGDFQQLTPDLRKALVLHLIKQQNPAAEISRDGLKRVEELPKLQTGQSVTLSGSVVIIRDRERYCIKKTQQALSSVSATFGRDDLLESETAVNGLLLKVSGCRLSEVTDQGTIYLDAEKVAWPVTVRYWQDGDRFRPLGMEGHQLVSDHLTNRKVSAAHRQKALVVESFEETICAVIFPPIKKRAAIGTVSERVKCDAYTRQCLRITYNE